MTVSNGQLGNQTTLNNAFASKSADNTMAGEQTFDDNVTINGNLTVNGATTTVNTTNMDVTDKNITVNDGGNDASSEGAGITVERTGTDGSIIYKDTSATKFAIGAVGSEVDAVDISTAQTITNKSIDADNNPITNLRHGAEVDNLANGAHGVTGNVVGTDSSQTLILKNIDGGTATDSSRITLPKNTTANLDALTDKEGTITYDTTLSKPVFNNGTDNIELAVLADISGNEPSLIANNSLAAAASAGALTIDLETQIAATPTSVDAVSISFLNATLATGTYNIRSVTVDLDATIPSTATLGYANGDDARVHVYALDNSGTVELAFAGSRIFKESGLHTTVALSTGSDLGTTLYSTALRSNVPIRYLGFVQIDAITTAGTWTAPDEIRLNQGQPEEPELLAVELSADTVSVLANTFEDVTGGTLTLRPGIWDLAYHIALALADTSGSANDMSGNLIITDSSDVLVDTSTCFVRSSVLAANGNLTFDVTRSVRLTVTSTDTYKLRLRSVDAIAVGAVVINGDGNAEAGLSDPDHESTFQARRVEQ